MHIFYKISNIFYNQFSIFYSFLEIWVSIFMPYNFFFQHKFTFSGEYKWSFSTNFLQKTLKTITHFLFQDELKPCSVYFRAS